MGCKFHCCPFVVWNHVLSLRNDGDLVARVYTSVGNDYGLSIPLYIEKFEKYIKKWIDHIEKIIEAINNYNENIYDILPSCLNTYQENTS
jgi:hypothetical protein